MVEQVVYNSRMRYELSAPYSTDWRRGYLQESKDGRKYVVLYNSNKDRSVTSYARYLMAVKIGRYLTDEEEVDHKDEDKTNDSLDNLQILTGHENKVKNHEHRKAVRVPKHGTLTEYRYCKCSLCVAAKSAHSKEYKRRLSKVVNAPAL